MNRFNRTLYLLAAICLIAAAGHNKDGMAWLLVLSGAALLFCREYFR